MPLALQALGRLTLKCGLTQSVLPSCPGALSPLCPGDIYAVRIPTLGTSQEPAGAPTASLLVPSAPWAPGPVPGP